jgi:hypothetical protein
MNSNRQLFLNFLTASGAELTCISGIDLDYFPGGPFRLPGEHFNEHSPATVSYTLRQMPVSDHALYIQLFNVDGTEDGDVGISHFVQEILSLISYFFMRFGYQDLCLSPSVGTSLPSSHSSLSSSEDFLRLPEKLRIADAISERIDEKGFDADIEADFDIRLRQFSCFNVIAREADEPVAGRCTSDGDCFYIASNRTGQEELEPAYTSDVEISTDDLPACLLQSEGIISISSPESWESSLVFFALDPAEKCIESSLQSLNYILKHLRAYNFKLREFFFKVRQLIFLGNTGDRFFILPVGIDPLIESKVIEYAACFEPLQAIDFSLLIYLGSILKGFSHFFSGMNQLLFGQVLKLKVRLLVRAIANC